MSIISIKINSAPQMAIQFPLLQYLLYMRYIHAVTAGNVVHDDVNVVVSAVMKRWKVEDVWYAFKAPSHFT